ncbi:Gas vesicle structural protein 1 [uncultured archaeon]|nr:Gas vesicle structural protein 1 [uncultured archaeon]
MTSMAPARSQNLADVVERILDKGLVINADIAVSVAGTELLGIKIRATLASFETAAKYGLELPSGTNLNAPGWKELDRPKAYCPECGNRRDEEKLLKDGCPVCGWISPLQSLPVIRPQTENYD